jgi:excinuclease ABC subunit B
VDDPAAKHIRIEQGRGAARGRARPSAPTPRGRGAAQSGPEKELPRLPTLDEMGPGVESIPSKSGPRSQTGRPGMRGGWRPRGR